MGRRALPSPCPDVGIADHAFPQILSPLGDFPSLPFPKRNFFCLERSLSCASLATFVTR